MRLIQQFLITSAFIGAVMVCEAQSTNILYLPPASGGRDNYTGAVGCSIKAHTNFVVSHLGFYSTNTSAGMAASHQVGLFTGGAGANPPIYGQVVVPAGTSALWMSNYYWVTLNPPLLMVSNSTYTLVAMTGNADGDYWPDGFSPTWNPAIVAATTNSGGQAVYGPGNNTWPPTSLANNGANKAYGAPSLANIPVGAALAGVLSTNVSATVGTTLSVVGFASGQLPISYQWYTSPGTPLAGQTNATLVIPNVPTNASGTYFLIASNSLGNEQSANVTVSITAVPVTISQQPTNQTVYQNYTASYSVTASGSQPISYQWRRNGTPITGATTTSYSLVAAMANNGDAYSCQVTNAISSINTSNASLTVIPNLAPPGEFLHGAYNDANNNGYSQGMLGGVFTTGSTPSLVTHLGFFAVNYTDQNKTNATLSAEHHVGIFSADGTVLYASVDIQPGTYGVTNGYIWAQLNPLFVLPTNTTCLLLAQTGGDPLGDTYQVPDPNPFYLGTNTTYAVYTGANWPTPGTLYGRYIGQMYSAPNLALLPMGVSIALEETNVTQYAGLDQTLSALVGGQPPITSIQWYEEPGTALSGDTNLVVDLGGLTTNQSGNYFVIASNILTSASGQSADAVVTVLPDNPSITTNVQSQSDYRYQTVQLTAGFLGRPPLSYQWTFNGNAIAGATNSVLTLTDVSAANIGNYQLIISNAWGVTNSGIANVQVTTPVWGGYASGVMNTNLLLYYRFSDVSNFIAGVTNLAVNQGSLGIVANGTYEGSAYEISGPAVSDPDEGTNPAIQMDGYDTDVLIPSPGNLTISGCTIAGWVYDEANPQAPNAAIFFHRQASVFGLSVDPNSNNADELRATWGGNVYDSQLVLAPNQWVFVAMSVSPTGITVYTDDGTGMQSTNFSVSASPASLSGVSYIGYDTQSTSRRWNGGLDEMMVFDQALTATEVKSLYLGVPQSATLTITPSTGNNLTVTWPGGQLQQAASPLGPWTPTSNATNGVYTTPASGTKFYRVQLQ